MLYVDGELEPTRAVELESHLRACEPCQSQVELVRTMRASLRRSCARSAPSAMESRMRAALASCGSSHASGHGTVEARSAIGDASFAASAASGGAKPSVSRRGRHFAVAGAVAFAACFVVVVILRNESAKSSFSPMHAVMTSKLASSMPMNDEASLDTLLDELVSQHANPLPPEEKNPEDLTRLEPYVGVPVRRPALMLLRNPKVDNASFDGARIHRVRNTRTAAALQYKLKGHRLTIYVFDPNKIPIRRSRLRTRDVPHESPIYVGHMRGFSVAAAEREGVGYALASDLDEDKSVQMVASF